MHAREYLAMFLVIALPAAVAAETINFEVALSEGTVLTTLAPNPGVSFSGGDMVVPGLPLGAFDGNSSGIGAGGPDNANSGRTCSTTGSGTSPIIITFASPVRDVSLDLADVEAYGVGEGEVVVVSVFDVAIGGLPIYSDTVSCVGRPFGEGDGALRHVDLSGFAGLDAIRRLEVARQSGSGNFGWAIDNVGYDMTPAENCAGLPTYPLGAATLATEGDSLVISEIGASGADGVEIALDYFTGLEFLWGGEGLSFDAVEDSAAELNLTLYVAVPEGALLGPLDPLKGISVGLVKKPVGGVPGPSHVAHHVDFSELDATEETLVIMNHGVTQYRALVPNGTEVNVFDSPSIIAGAITERGVQVITDADGDGVLDPTYTAVAFHFTDPFPMEVDGVAYTGDRIIFMRHGGVSTGEIRGLGVRGTAPMPGSTIHTIRLSDIRPIALGALFGASGGTMFDALPQGPAVLAVLAPPGGGDLLVTQGGGIAGGDIETWTMPAGDPAIALGMSMLDPDAGGTLPIGAALTIAADGVAGGVSDAPLGWCAFALTPPPTGPGVVAGGSPVVQLIANFADLGASQKRVELRNGGVLIHGATTALDTVAAAAEFPTATRYDLAATQGSEAGFVLHWPAPVTVRAGGVDYTADEVRIGMTGGGTASVTNPSAVAHLGLRGHLIPGLTFTATTSVEVATGVAGSHQVLAPDRALRLSVWPNPSAGGVEMRVDAPTGASLQMDVFDVGGRHVRTLAAGGTGSGVRTLSWNARDDSGAPVSPGVYFVRGVIERPGSRSESVEGRFVIVR